MTGKSAIDEIAWTPNEAIIGRSRLLTLMQRHGFSTDMAGFEQFNEKAVSEPEWYWREVVRDLQIEFTQPFTAVLDESRGKQFPQWFTGGELNVANLSALRHASGNLASKTAVIYEADNGERRTLTFQELAEKVRWFAAHLKALGVSKGDRVVLFMPVVPEAAVAFLAIAMIGAISVPTFSGYAADALAARLEDSGAKLLITADGTTRRGKPVDMKSVADEALEQTNVEHVIVLRRLDSPVNMKPDRDIFYHELAADIEAVQVENVEANDPLTLVYTSGTTGRPKGIVHSHAGFAAKTAVDFAYGFDVTSDDVVSWITDLGWLVGPMLMVGPLQLGATIVMVEGLPVYPEPTRLWETIKRNGVTVQGVAPTGIRALKAAGGSQHDMPTLKAFVSTGEAWDEPTWWWLFEEIGNKQVPIINFSGGTEVSGGLLNGYACFPAPAAAFSGPLPGVRIDVLSEKGESVVGEIGELVVRNTFPGMTHSFWNDDERYLGTYWNQWEDIWVHGDLASVDENGIYRIHGRSDDTLKLSGRRVGPAEIEAALLRDDRIADVAVVGVPDEVRGQRAVAFVTLKEKNTDADDLQAVALKNTGKGFATEVIAVETLPKTKNGKIMRRIIKARFLGEKVGDTSALDPQTPIEDIPVMSSTTR